MNFKTSRNCEEDEIESGEISCRGSSRKQKKVGLFLTPPFLRATNYKGSIEDNYGGQRFLLEVSLNEKAGLFLNPVYILTPTRFRLPAPILVQRQPAVLALEPQRSRQREPS